MRTTLILKVALLVTLAASSCASEADESSVLKVVVTTSILGDIVSNVVDGAADVEVVIPVGADPHEFEPSAQQVASLRSADLIVAVGLGLEESLSEVLEAAVDEGAALLEVGPNVDPMPLEIAGELDPHVWLDPIRVEVAAVSIAEALAELDGSIDWLGRSTAYRRQLIELDAWIVQRLEAIPVRMRVLFTGHRAFGYFADRYGFEVTAAVLPGATTMVEPSASGFSEVAEALEASTAPAVFTDLGENQALAEQLVNEVSRTVLVVPLYMGTLGDAGSGAETYLDLMRWNVDEIAAVFEQ